MKNEYSWTCATKSFNHAGLECGLVFFFIWEVFVVGGWVPEGEGAMGYKVVIRLRSMRSSSISKGYDVSIGVRLICLRG